MTIKLNHSRQKLDTMKWLNTNLHLAKICLEKYKETKDEEYLNHYENFKQWIDKIKQYE